MVRALAKRRGIGAVAPGLPVARSGYARRMRLYVTPASPYARMARIVVIEKGLGARVEIVVARTREADSPYYRINPSGRVPYLLRDDGVGMEGSALVCAYLDRMGGAPYLAQVDADDAWEARRLDASARSLLDGLAVWAREVRRADGERSPAMMAHEAARAMRLVARWEACTTHPLLVAPFHMLQVTLACALALEARLPEWRWRETHPALARWYDAVAQRPSFAATAPSLPVA